MYQTNDVVVGGADQVISGIVTDQAVSYPYSLSASDSLYHVVRIVASGVTVVGSITAKLQESWDNGASWEAVGSEGQATISADGTAEIRLIANDATDAGQLPLAPKCRVVLTTTNAGDGVTVSSVLVSQRS